MTTQVKFETIEANNQKDAAPGIGAKINAKFAALNDARKALAHLIFGVNDKVPLIDPTSKDTAAADIKKLHAEVMNTAKTADIQHIASATRTQIRNVFKSLKVTGGTDTYRETIAAPSAGLTSEEFVLEDHAMDAFIERFADPTTPPAHPPAPHAPGHTPGAPGHPTDGQGAGQQAHGEEPVFGKWSNLGKTLGVVGGGTALAAGGLSLAGIPAFTFLKSALTWGPVVSMLNGLGLASVTPILAPILGGLSIPLAVLPVFSWIRDKFSQARAKGKGLDYKAPKRGYFDRLWHGAGTFLAPFKFTKDVSESGLELSGKALGKIEKNAKDIVGNTVFLPVKKTNRLAAALFGALGFILGGPVGAGIGAYAGAGVKELADHTEGKTEAGGHDKGHDKKGGHDEDDAEKPAH